MNKRIRKKHIKMIFDRSQYDRIYVLKMIFRVLKRAYKRAVNNIHWSDDDDS